MSCYTLQDQGGCGCATPTNTTLLVTGCNGLALTAAPVSVSQGGATVATGTTDAAGHLALSLPDNTSIDVTCTAQRFNSHTFSGVTPVAGGTTTVAMSPYVNTTTYACFSGCAYPVKRSLLGTAGTASASKFSTATMAYDGTSKWVNATPTDYLGCGLPPACQAVNAVGTLSLTSAAAAELDYPTTGSNGSCPVSGGGVTARMTFPTASNTLTCWTPTTAFSFSSAIPTDAFGNPASFPVACNGPLYCTITE